MTFAEWMALHSDVHVNHNVGNGTGTQVFSRDAELWHLSDYLVSSTASGPSVYLIPRPTPTAK
jgi:hypothetical protein